MVAGQPYSCRMLGSDLQWTNIPSRGSNNALSRFALQKAELVSGGSKGLPLTLLLISIFNYTSVVYTFSIFIYIYYSLSEYHTTLTITLEKEIRV